MVLAAAKARGARRRFRDDVKPERLDPGFTLAVVVGIRAQQDVGVGHPRLEHEGAGPDGFLLHVALFDNLPGYDGQIGQVGEKRREGPFEGEDDGPCVGCRHRGHLGKAAGSRRTRLLGHDAVVRVDDVLARHGATVMKRHAVPQCEGIG